MTTNGEHQSDPRRLRVLVCDDELGMRLGAQRALQGLTVKAADLDAEFGFDVALAETGEEAMGMIEADPPQSVPDILLLDLKLPGLSGLDVLDHFADKGLPMLTIMITAYATIETAVRATKQGAYDFLAKPFTPAELKNAVRKASEHIIVMREARRLAEEKRQVRFQFISVLAHELKAPLAAVEGYLRVLENPEIAANKEVYGQAIERSIIRLSFMRKMIADLLDLTRIESGKKKREIGPVNVREIAERAIESAKPDADRRGIAISLESAGRETLTGDANEIEIVMNNLTSNAVKYNRDGGSVAVRLAGDDDRVTIAVSDTGMGMTQEEAAKLFNDFVRIRNEKTQHILGSGLGLSIVKKIAALYGGEVAVTSKPDVGSTFTVTLKRQVAGVETEQEALAEV